MDNLEKVEKLRERANVSYEEAKAALDAAGGDLLDAIVMLERSGKTKNPGQESFSTSYEEQKNYVRVRDKVEEQKASAPGAGKKMRQILRDALALLLHNSFCISRKGETIIMFPGLIFVIAMLFAWKGLLLVMIIALFFGFRYSFMGPNDPSAVNDILDKVGNLADDVKQEFNKEK